MAPAGSIRTLEQFHTTGRTITAFCSHYWVCSHDAQLRLELIAHHLGWEFDFYAGRTYLASRLYCSICGWYAPTFALGHANRPASYAGSHGAGFNPVSVADAAKLSLDRKAEAPAGVPWTGVRTAGRKFGR